MPDRPFRALSIDGGGMRGAYTAAYLETVAKGFAARDKRDGLLDIGAGFDLIVGCSTGAIIALALAKGIPLSRVLALYREHGKKVFPVKIPGSLPGVLCQEFFKRGYLKRGEQALREALTQVFDDITLGQLFDERKIAICIPAVNMGSQRAWVFKTSHLSTSNHRDDDYKLVDICLASSAAPLYRSLASIDTPGNSGAYNVFADGGLWANNPVLVALTEALAHSESGRAIEIFSLGTCPRPEGDVIARDDVHWPLHKWKFGGRAAQVSIAAQEFAFDHMARMLARHIGRPCCMVRFPSKPVPASVMEYLDLDDARPKAIDVLINQAQTDAHMTNSVCSDPTSADGKLICALFASLPLARV